MTAPDRIYINKVHGQHPEDWDFTDGKYLTKKQLAAKVEYIRADLAALEPAPTDAAQVRECCDLCGSDVTDMDGHLVHDEGCNGDTYAPAAQAREAALREAVAIVMEECWKEREMKLASRIEKRILALIGEVRT